MTSVQAFEGRRGCPAKPLAFDPSAEGLAEQGSKKSFDGLSSVLVLPSTDILSRAGPQTAVLSAGRPEDGTGQVTRRRLASGLRDQFAQEDNGIRALRMVQ